VGDTCISLLELIHSITALARHMKICEKVFIKKRKPMEVKRLTDEAARELKQLQRQNAKKPSKSAAPEDPNKMPKWKQERAQLLEALRAGM
jgi:hypothetical protein